MKRLLLPLTLITLLLSSCEKIPFADFIPSSTSVQPQDIITFRNTSNNATSFDWDFGDNTTSNSYSPTHAYAHEGTYTVVLTAHGNGKISVARSTIDVYYLPQAVFSVDSKYYQPYDVINFYNTSVYADSYDWDFGDGTYSTAANPAHSYTKEGYYNVVLTAHSNNGFSSTSTIQLEVFYTALEVTVAEWNSNYVLNNLISGVSVILYPTLADWDNETNPVAEGTTDASGVVVFSGLNTQSYYIDAWNPSYNNWTLRNDDPGFITTDPLGYARYNTFTAWVDYSPTPSAGRDRKNLGIPKINVPKRTYIKLDVSK